MALGTAVVTKHRASNVGPLIAAQIAIPLDNSYPAGGYTAFKAYVRKALVRPGFELLGVLANECSGYVPVYDSANDKLKIYFGDNNNASDGPLIENTTGDLHLITLNVIVIGY